MPTFEGLTPTESAWILSVPIRLLRTAMLLFVVCAACATRTSETQRQIQAAMTKSRRPDHTEALARVLSRTANDEQRRETILACDVGYAVGRVDGAAYAEFATQLFAASLRLWMSRPEDFHKIVSTPRKRDDEMIVLLRQSGASGVPDLPQRQYDAALSDATSSCEMDECRQIRTASFGDCSGAGHREAFRGSLPGFAAKMAATCADLKVTGDAADRCKAFSAAAERGHLLMKAYEHH